MDVYHSVKVHVINLKESVERRASICAQLEPLGVQYRFFAAISGDRGRECFDGYDLEQSLINTGRVPSAGEIGCYASHRSLWRRCVADNAPIVIMEDDAEIQTGFLDSLREVERLIPDYGFIRLQRFSRQSDKRNRKIPVTPVEKSGRSTLYYCENFPYGAMCYAISPRVAASFIEKSRVFTGPVDLFIKRFWEHGQPLFALSPYSVEGSALRELTTIGGRAKARAGIGFRMLRTLNKLKHRIGRARFNAEYHSRLKRNAESSSADSRHEMA